MSSTDILVARSSLHRMVDQQLPAVNIVAPESYLITETGEAIKHARIACIIPAYNEEKSIGAVLTALLASTRLPDTILVVVNGTTDMTLEVIKPFLGNHTRIVRGIQFDTQVFVHDLGKVSGKVNALNEGYKLVSKGGFDFILGVDGDTVVAPDCIEKLELEMADDPRIGGLSAIYTVDYDESKTVFGKFLLAGQKAQFASFSMDNLLRNRHMAVLGGQCSLFSVPALEAVKAEFKQATVWTNDSEVEDSLLSLQIKKVGYSTKISSTARATVGGMTTVRALHGQQVKWNAGAIELMKQNPFHPNLRLRWFENVSMLSNILTRFAFVLLLAGSLSIHAFIFSPIWLIPPVVAVLLNVKVAASMKSKHPIDMLYAATLVPAEFYMWIRMSHFVSAWMQVIANNERDNWGAQALAENGKGGVKHLWPAFIATVILGASAYSWIHLSGSAKSTALELGWPALFVFTVTQCFFLVRRVLRRNKGFTA